MVDLLEGIDGQQHVQPGVYEDNQGAILFAKNPVTRQRCKREMMLTLQRITL